MVKRKRLGLFQNNIFLVLCLVLGIGFFGQSFFGRSNTKVLGEHSDKNGNNDSEDNSSKWSNNGWNNNSENNSSQNNNPYRTITSTITEGVVVTSVVTVDPIITDTVVLPSVTVSQRLQGRSAAPAIDNSSNNSGDNSDKDAGVFDHPSLQTGAIQTQTIYTTEKVVVYVPVSEKSVTQANNNHYVPPKQNVIKSIQNKIQEVSRGEFISKPSPTVTLKVPTLKEASEETSILTGDVDIFYRFQGDSVVLAAQNSENNLLSIKEEDLRSAEVTLNKILENKKVKLNVTNESLFALVQDGVVVTTGSPIRVNIDSQKIFLETSEGKKELKVLPMQAIKEAVDLKSFEKLNAKSVPSIENFGDELSYKVVGDKTYKVFGLIEVKAKQNVYIAAETGEVTEGDQPLMTRIIRLISL
jgi:hypothetical protein